MKRILYTFLTGLICTFTAIGQPYDLTLNTAESGTQLHQATNSITLAAGYSYTPSGGTMLAETVSPNMIGTISYNYSPVDPANRSLNTSYLVGATQAAFDVNPAGGASYSIPIDVLPGVNGLAPSLSLVYSSNTGSGVAGYGWQIGGVSVVSRSGQNYYNDGAARGVELDYSDKFALDGQRLVSTSGVYGYDKATYQTENETFTRVQSISSSGNGPLQFMAQSKPGLKNLYGSNNHSSQRIEGYSEIINWFLTETSDLYGNIINYSYLEDHSAIYPAEITYGLNKVSFYYKMRTDVTTSYLKGKQIQQRLLLDKITVAYNSNVVKTYELKYNYLSNSYLGQSVLNEIIESGTGGGRLNSTVFSYHQPGDISLGAETYLHTQADISTNSTLFTGDFNGDGLADILTLDKATGKTIKLYLANNTFDCFTLSYQNTYNHNLDNIVVTDLNGDGKDDLVLVDFNWIVAGYNYVISNGTSFSSPVLLGNYNCNTRPFYMQNDLAADYDGDGKNDILVKASYNGTNTWAIFSLANGSSYSLGSGSISSWGDKSYNGDFNGDGKSDIWIFDANGLKIYSLSGTSLNQIYTSTWPTKDHYFQLGDFNGDGKTDMFVYGYSSYDWTDWQIHLATGTGFEGHSFTAKKSNLKDDKVYTADFNSDGRTDILALSKNSSNNPRQYYLISNLNGTNFSSQYQENSYLNKDYNFALGDFSGDGKTDILVTPSSTGFRRLVTIGSENNYLLKLLSDGLGNTIETVYSRLTNPYCYEKTGGSSSFPVFTYQGPLTVMNRVWYNGAATKSLEYTYKGLNIHRQGKGILGFSQINVTDYVSGILTKTQAVYNTTYFSPLANTITKKATNGTTVETDDTIIETATSNYTQTVLDATTKRIFPYVQSATQTNVLTNQSVTTTVSGYDNYGNPGTISKTFKTGFTDEGSQSVTYLYQSENVANWLLGRQTKATTTYTKGTESVIQVVNREFSNTTKRDTAEVWYPGTDKQIRNSHVFYANGNIRKEMATSGGVSRSTSYVYNADNVRVDTKKDPVGHITTYTYYPTNGWMQTEKDYLNNTYTYTYDNLGRVLTKTQFDGFVTTNTYNWGLNTFTNSVYNLTTSGNDGSESKTWYDKLGREIRLDVKGFDDQYIYTVTNYTTAGQTQQVSEPNTSANPSQWIKYEYYPEGRLKKVERHTGSITNYTYSGITATENTDGKVRYKETNSQGLLTKAHDAGGDILYAYYPDGKVKTITAPGNAVTTMEYNDAARNQTKLIDPSAGTIQYTYDGFGQLKTQTNALGQLTTSNYYADGRIDNVIYPSSPVNEGTTAYSYNSNKQLAGISNPTTNVSSSYGYDPKGRVNSTGETIAGSTFTTSFTFDTKGRLDTRTHPSGIVEKMNYKTNGYFEYISVGGTTWYKVTGMNARQQITTATYGSGSTLNATYGFDTYGYPNSTVTGNMQNYGYSFEPVKGNLNWRKNVNRSNIQENFLYDSLDRLDSIYGNANSLGGVDYDFAKGNITRRSGIGKIGYNHPTIPYAITDLTAVSALYPASPDSIKQRAYYTSFNKIRLISDYPSYRADFLYNSNQQRAKMTIAQNGSAILTRWYAGGSYMKETAGGVTKEYTYLGGDAYTAPVAAITQSGATTYYYLLRDYLGNITHVYNTSTSTAQEYSFDAWGRRRNPVNWSYDLTGQPDLFADRGFTSHEYLKWFNVINMNGRLYDPLVGRFMNPDPYVQMPDYTQNFNRYSYCLNNPLKFTDPDGEWFGLDDLAEFIVGGVVNVIFNADKIDNFWEGLAYFGSGGVGTWISVQSFGLAAPVGAAITSFGNNMLETNFLTKEEGYSFKSIKGDEWGRIAKKTVIGAASGWVGNKLGGKLSDKVQDKLHITSEFWTEATDKMIENGISDGLGNYLNSTIVDHNGWTSKEAFKDLGMGIGEGIAKGMTFTLLDQKWARPELQKLNGLGYVLNIKKDQWNQNIFRNLYNPLLPPGYKFPSPPKFYLPNSNN